MNVRYLWSPADGGSDPVMLQPEELAGLNLQVHSAWEDDEEWEEDDDGWEDDDLEDADDEDLDEEDEDDDWDEEDDDDEEDDW